MVCILPTTTSWIDKFTLAPRHELHGTDCRYLALDQVRRSHSNAEPSTNDSILKFSQLTKDILAASVAIHEQRNLLAPINRLPLDVLLLIPMHFDSLSDRLRVTLVCRRWRRAFIQHPPLWSQLYLAGSTNLYLFVTLLQRVSGTPLDITIDNYASPIRDATPLSPFTAQIRSLEVRGAFPHEVQAVSIALSGPLSLLHTLVIDARESFSRIDHSAPDVTLPLFTNAVNLKYFSLTMNKFPSLFHFTFPNLTSFFLSTWPDMFAVSQLLDFLETSPALQHIFIMIEPISNFDEDVSPERVVVLPHVKAFNLYITNDHPNCKIATHISCPSAKRTRFDYTMECAGWHVPEDIYPSSRPLNTIVHQYSKGTADQVVLELTMPNDDEPTLECSLKFCSFNGTTITLNSLRFSLKLAGKSKIIQNWLASGIFTSMAGVSLQAISSLQRATLGDFWDLWAR